MIRGFCIDQRVTWIDPVTPKQGHQLARVLDVAGHYVLLQNETGTQTGKKAWVHRGSLVPQVMDLVEVLRSLKIQANREEASRAVAKGRNDQPWGVSCLVCFGPLQQPRTQAPLPRWLYCPTCDRMQRHQEKPVQSEPRQRRKTQGEA
ncbi:MAG: hypothetical protein LC623_08515 [Halobacteriales archaeon]|nr:hypothetical protein [Halobacteriales archaeon]